MAQFPSISPTDSITHYHPTPAQYNPTPGSRQVLLTVTSPPASPDSRQPTSTPLASSASPPASLHRCVNCCRVRTIYLTIISNAFDALLVPIDMCYCIGRGTIRVGRAISTNRKDSVCKHRLFVHQACQSRRLRREHCSAAGPVPRLAGEKNRNSMHEGVNSIFGYGMWKSQSAPGIEWTPDCRD